jgi:hypothetical protein
MLFLLSFLISKNTKSSLEEGFRLTQIMGSASSSSTNISIQLMIKYEYKKETLIESTIENRLNDLGGKGWELVLLMPIPLRASLDVYRIF